MTTMLLDRLCVLAQVIPDYDHEIFYNSKIPKINLTVNAYASKFIVE